MVACGKWSHYTQATLQLLMISHSDSSVTLFVAAFHKVLVQLLPHSMPTNISNVTVFAVRVQITLPSSNFLHHCTIGA